MPALDFPASPSNGQPYSGPGGVVWVWDGAKWVNGTSAMAYAPIANPAFTGNPTAPTPAVGDADTSIATTAFVAAAVAPALNNAGRNLLHNALFNVQQRGAGAFSTSAAFTADRWQMAFSGGTLSVALNAANDTIRAQIGDEVPTNICSVTVAGTAGAGDYALLAQHIESVYRLAGKTVVLSFWAACGSGTPKLGVSMDQSFGTGGSPSANVNGTGQSVTLSTAYQRFALIFTVPSAAGKTFGSTAGTDWTSLQFWFSSGATNNTRAGGIGVQSATFGIWGIQLEIGTQATPLEKLDPRIDRSNCQRFYQIGTVALQAYSPAGAGFGGWQPFPTTMRGTPAVAFQSPSYTNASNIISNGASLNGLWPMATATAAGTALFSASYTASADL